MYCDCQILQLVKQTQYLNVGHELHTHIGAMNTEVINRRIRDVGMNFGRSSGCTRFESLGKLESLPKSTFRTGSVRFTGAIVRLF